MNPILECNTEISVPFHDVDYMDVVWHGHFVKYLEIIRCKLFQVFDYDVPEMKKSGFAWPVIHMKIKYIKPAKYNQVLLATARLMEYENRVRISYTVADSQTGEKICTAETDQVAVNVESGEMNLASPPVLINKIKSYLEKN